MSTHGEKSWQFKFEIMDMHYKEGISVKILSEKFGIPEATIYT